MITTFTKCNCYNKIQKLRTELIKTGMEFGLTHPSTVKLSQSLDKVLNECFIIGDSANKSN
ncbi:aspartyl-phosphate phosphatase Spo0E family protein [Ureibacillus sinduriensis]|uniref:aspartyl-phosphate phosphatase Spo0E family protein n=1 Tax=Ureibacillus sinduriensis TaxID=561440 RepID=UPI00068971C6|nr:aspartyl-phosphate phosphatase Spo0E family protein [Ureibacillus sinduriensis]